MAFFLRHRQLLLKRESSQIKSSRLYLTPDLHIVSFVLWRLTTLPDGRLLWQKKRKWEEKQRRDQQTAPSWGAWASVQAVVYSRPDECSTSMNLQHFKHYRHHHVKRIIPALTNMTVIASRCAGGGGRLAKHQFFGLGFAFPLWTRRT